MSAVASTVAGGSDREPEDDPSGDLKAEDDPSWNLESESGPSGVVVIRDAGFHKGGSAGASHPHAAPRAGHRQLVAEGDEQRTEREAAAAVRMQSLARGRQGRHRAARLRSGQEAGRYTHQGGQELRIDDGNPAAMHGFEQMNFRVPLKINGEEASDRALQQQMDALLKKLSKGIIPTPPSAPGSPSQSTFEKISSSPYTQRSDSVVKQPRFRIVGRTFPPRTLPLVPGPGTALLIRSGIVTPRPAAGPFSGIGTVPRRGSSVYKEGLMEQTGDKMTAREQNFRPASAPSISSAAAPRSPALPLRPATCRSVCRKANPCPNTPSSHHRVRPPASAKSRKSVASTISSQSWNERMLDNPYEMVAWAMTDKTNNSIPRARWPYVSTWVSGEPRYEGYCTPVLPANSTYGILGPCRQDEKVVPPRCGMEFLEQLYGASLQMELPLNCAPEISSVDQNQDLQTSRGMRLSVLHHMHQADETDERVWESERRGRALLDFAAQERFRLAQVDAVEELARENDTFYKGLHRSDRTLYWAERKSREKMETERKASFGARELLQARYQRVLHRWSTIVYQKSFQLALRMRQAAAGVRSRRTHAITKIQSIVRGWLATIRVRKIRRGMLMRKFLAVAKMQALFRGWKDRQMCKFLRELRVTSNAAKRLFKAQNAFQQCDVDGDGFISADEFVGALKQNGIFLDALAIQAILASLPLKSDYRKAVAAAEKKRMYNNDLFLKGKSDKWCEAPLPGQSHPLSFSDFCCLVDLDVSAAAMSKMQEAIKIFAKFDADGSGAIDGDEVARAIEEMQKFTGVPVRQEMLNASLRLGDGELDFAAFVKVFGLDTGSSDAALDDQVDLAFRSFRELDTVGAGEIGPQELIAGLNKMGVEVGLDEAQQMIDEVDEKGSGKIDFIEFCTVGGLHNISERLKRKYIAGYIGEEEEEEEEVNMSMTLPQPGSPAYPSKKEKEIQANSFEDGEALVGHPHSLCTPVVGLRVRPSRSFRSGTLNGAGTIVEVAHISRSKMRVRVQHDNNFERYYDCGSHGRFELVVLPKIYLTDAQLTVYYKSQPHLMTSEEDQLANMHDKSCGLRRFDHLYRSLFDLQSLSIGQDEGSRNKVRVQREQIIARIRDRLQRVARVKWDLVKILVRSPNGSPLNRKNSGAKHPEATAQDAPSEVPLVLQLAYVESKGKNVTSSFKRQSSPAALQAVVAQKGTEDEVWTADCQSAVEAQNKAKASGGSEGIVEWTNPTAGDGGMVAYASAEGQLEDQTWEQRMNQRDAELRTRKISQGSFRGSFMLTQSRGGMVASTSAEDKLGAPTWEQKINQQVAELRVQRMSQGSFRGSFRRFESRDDAFKREQTSTKAAAQDTSFPSLIGTVSSHASASQAAVPGACEKDNSEAMEGSMRPQEPVGLQSKRLIFGMGASFKGRQSFRENFTEVALKLSHQTEASSPRRPQSRSSLS